MKQIYILLSRTSTIPSRMIHTIGHQQFSHVSIAVEASTDSFYSYARRAINNPLIGGFINEDTHAAIFAKYSKCPCMLFSVDVPDDAYEKIVKEIKFCIDNYNKCKYDFLGLLLCMFKIKHSRKYRFTCSHFVAKLLEDSNTCWLPKDPSLMKPTDFLKLTELNLIYSGSIGDCNFDNLPKMAKI